MNYLSYVRIGCLLAGQPDQVFQEPALQRAKVAIKKRLLFIPREPMFIRHPMLIEALQYAEAFPKWKLTVTWMLTAYVFMARVPSECLPLTIVNGEVKFGVAQRHQSELHLKDNEVVLCLKRRKNRLYGGKIHRFCWCKWCKETYPAHTLGKLLAEWPVGSMPFKPFTARKAINSLRIVLTATDVPNAENAGLTT